LFISTLEFDTLNIWNHCLSNLKSELPVKQFNTWIMPLQVEEDANANRIKLFAPNSFVLSWVKNHYLDRMRTHLNAAAGDMGPVDIRLTVGSRTDKPDTPAVSGDIVRLSGNNASAPIANPVPSPQAQGFESNLNAAFTFEAFVEGKSNQIAKAASLQVGQNPGVAYNPLFIYGGVGLGKTHLMHAVGNLMLQANPSRRVVYVTSERFVSEMVKALQENSIDDFKRRYRSVNALLIDDIQFFAGKERSQEEFFHTFNALFESQQQIVLSSDRFPKEVNGLEERLKSRFGWGLTVAIDPPDLETRVAIIQRKANILYGMELPDAVAFFMGERIRSNIRELEGGLRKLIANAQFTGKPITLEFAKEALRDAMAAQDKQVTIENIQKTVAEYFKIRTKDLISPKRSRSIARPRQIAMTLAKELTNHSLPEIGKAFGGRDHTTVLHANRKIKELRETDPRIAEDMSNLLRTLTS